MNYGISVLFRLIPLVMGAVCLFLGIDVLSGLADAQHFTAGQVLISLTAICFALFTTAAVIIRQLTNTFNRFWMFLLPLAGYGVAIITMIWGAILIYRDSDLTFFVAGHVVFGVGMIAACVSTVAAASSHFTLIPRNAAGKHADGAPKQAYSAKAGALLIAIPVICSVVGFVWAIWLLSDAQLVPHYVAGNVLLGLSAICASLIALVATVVRQVRNRFDEPERWYWSWWVILMGSAAIIWGLIILISSDAPYRLAPGCINICLGLICYSIVSKVWLLALVWRRKSPLANRVPLIPVFTCLACLFFSAFLTEAVATDAALFIPARVLVGLGAVCFTLFSIVSILEAGTSGKSAS